MQASPRRTRLALALIVLLGLALRAVNAYVAFIHGDERHYAEDTSWSVAPMPLGDAVRFLRAHPHPHERLDVATGRVTSWPTGTVYSIGGHPAFHATAVGVVQAIVRPTTLLGATLATRGVNLVADATTVALLPRLVATLGGGPASGLVAAALYAVFPPAVVYGSLANLDPFLAPLLVTLLVLVPAKRGALARWVAAGAVTGLLAATKQTGLLVFGLVPLLGGRDPRGVAAWAATAMVVLVAFVDPAAYLQSLRAPDVGYIALRLQPLDFVTGNLAVLAAPSSWYWLSFSYHGRPLAPTFAHVHALITPLYLLGYVLALPVLVWRRRWRAVVMLFAPTVALLAFVEPSNGTSRFHVAAPLVCAAIALAGTGLSRRAHFGLAVGAALVVLATLLPARLGPDGTVDLGDLLFWNPRSVQRQGFYPAWRSRHLAMNVAAGTPLSRRLWVTPGEYDVTVAAAGPVDVRVDGVAALAAGARQGRVALGRFPRLVVSSPRVASVTGLTLRRADGVSAAAGPPSPPAAPGSAPGSGGGGAGSPPSLPWP